MRKEQKGREKKGGWMVNRLGGNVKEYRDFRREGEKNEGCGKG